MRALKMVVSGNASHIGSALSICDIVAVLYGYVLWQARSKDYLGPNRDRFILSKGHACVTIYGTLAELNIISEKDVDSYGDDFSPLMNHISHTVPGVEFSTGSLGHGLPFGTGKALAAKQLKKSWRTFVLLSDGELDEGSNWESFLFAAHHKLDNLVAIVDYNKLQSIGPVTETLALEPLSTKLEAFGWSVREVNGHDHEELKTILSTTPWQKDKPSMVIAHTIKGKGVKYMENKVAWHYKTPTEEQLRQALEELNDA